VARREDAEPFNQQGRAKSGAPVISNAFGVMSVQVLTEQPPRIATAAPDDLARFGSYPMRFLACHEVAALGSLAVDSL